MAIYSGQRRLRLGGTGIAVLAWCSAACGSAGAKNVSEAGEAGVGAESGTDVGDTSTSDVPSSDTAEEDGELGIADTDAGSDAVQMAEGSQGDDGCPLQEVFSPPCNAIVPSGPLVETTCVSGEPPQPHGGVVADGIYVLESATWYGSCPGISMARTTMIACGGLWDTAEIATVDAAPQTIRVNFVTAYEDAAVVLNPICTTGSPLAGEADGYSASGGSLTVMTSYGTTVIAQTYKRQ
jgi:hypothetical protein